MIEWLRPLLMMFYAPARGMDEVRERAPLMGAVLLALVVQALYSLYTQWPHLRGGLALRSVFALVASGFSLLFIAFIFVPIAIFVANLFERRAGFGMVVQQEYVTVLSVLFYAWAAAGLAAFPLAIIGRAGGFEAAALESAKQITLLQATMEGLPPDEQQRLLNQALVYLLRALPALFLMSPLPLFVGWAVVGIRQVFRISWWRSVAVIALSGLLMIPATLLLTRLFGWIFVSPFLVLLLFLVLRGYAGELSRAHRARASFRQNLEAATLNPADASAHYNLGLIHQQRSEFEQAIKRFERAIEIDPEELDAHYQLGRIARAEGRLADAIKHFEQVVGREQTHAQHEIWREIGATYLAAEQFNDARDALERFLAHRPNDPEGLYLMGRALAGLGHQREAASSMQACIEAVKTAPAYKYRTEKRWLNEAQQFLRSQV
ncbi:MAG TPA: tetratricopeptide repeat protein [Pyrinomonadaceae bacterium]|jgi:tetratricopeptide (TPR) repeat protein|nr:tetratricopeptide repeat protein [Pyrinomonadaceae bacterium]